MLPVVVSFQRWLPQWIMPCIIHALCTPDFLHLAGSVTCIWLMKYGRRDTVWLLKLMRKTFCIFFLGLLKCSLFGHLEPSCHMMRGPDTGRGHTQVLQWTAPAELLARINCQPCEWVILDFQPSGTCGQLWVQLPSDRRMRAEGWDSVSDYYPLSLVNLQNCWTN